MKWLGLLAIGFYAVVAINHFYRGHPEEALWACHLGALIVGVGMLLPSPTWTAIGVTWLLVGVPLWVMDLALGGEFLWPSPLTHLGGLAIGIFGLRRMGMPTQVWWKALLALAALQQLCRWITPASTNVNVAFSVYAGLERWFPSYRLYLVFLLVTIGLVFFLTELILRRLMP